MRFHHTRPAKGNTGLFEPQAGGVCRRNHGRRRPFSEILKRFSPPGVLVELIGICSLPGSIGQAEAWSQSYPVHGNYADIRSILGIKYSSCGRHSTGSGCILSSVGYAEEASPTMRMPGWICAWTPHGVQCLRINK